MSDHERIWLQPECCTDPVDGRLWCQDPDPTDCENEVPWTEYVRADIAADLRAHAEALAGALEDRGTLIRRSQDLLTRFLEPGDTRYQTAERVVSALLGLLDGPEQRRIERRAHETLEAHRQAREE